MSMRKPEKEKVLGTFEIAKRCHVKPVTVYRWIKSGKLRAFQTAGGRNRVMESDFKALLKSLNIPDQSKKQAAKTIRILLVDDDAAPRRLMKRLIEKEWPEVKIDEASDGYEAGFKTRDLKPDLVILDLLLPGINGIKVCRIIRKSPDLKGTKIMAVTGYKAEKSRRVFLRAGANGFLTKPFSKDDFVRKIKQLINRIQ